MVGKSGKTMAQFEPRRGRTQSSFRLTAAKPDRAINQAARAENPLLTQQQVLSNQAVQRLLRTRVIQAKLTISQTGDVYEQEADRVAEQVMRMPGHQTPVGSADSERGQPSTVPPIVHEVLRSAGQPLDSDTRAFMEPRFVHDFSRVRVHTDASAAASARAINAQAYTSGRDIVFASGQYDNASARGLRLLAHELTHVVQQRSALASADVSAANDPAEREADRNAELLHTGRRLSFDVCALALARQAVGASTTLVTVEEPTGPNDCRLAQHRAIEPAVTRANEWLRLALERLGAYIRAPGDPANGSVRDALTTHFHSADAAIAGRVQAQLATIRTDISARAPFTVECHGTADPSCGNAGAYVRRPSLLVFCPAFFGTSATLEWRTGALIHEMAHALAGLHILDRAYRTDRVLPFLSTAEALNNAESYEMFTREVATGHAVRGTPPRDEIEDCPPATKETLIPEALGRAQRWNHRAETVTSDTDAAVIADSAALFTTHLGDATPATRSAARRIFSDTLRRLNSQIDVRCDAEAAPECSTRRAYKGSFSNVGRGLGIGAGIGGGLGLLFGLAAGFGAGSLALGLGVGLGLLGLGALIGLIAGAASPGTAVRVCPNWASLGTVEDRAESLLAAVYETYAGLDARQAQRHAALARALHTRYTGAPPPV
jgi:hypothetical protein